MLVFNYGVEIASNNGCFYPIHLDNEHLSYIVADVIGDIGRYNVIKAYVRKIQFTGVEFKIVCGLNNNLTDRKNISKQYSVLISPNWNVQIIDSWFSLGTKPRCQTLDEPSVMLNNNIHKYILSKINRDVEIKINSVFLEDEWSLVRKISDKSFLS